MKKFFFLLSDFFNQKKTDAGAFLELFYSPHPNNITFQKNIVFFVFVHFLFFSLTPVCCELHFFVSAWSQTRVFLEAQEK